MIYLYILINIKIEHKLYYLNKATNSRINIKLLF